MSVDIQYDEDKKILIIKSFGAFTFEDFSSAMETIVASSDYPTCANAIWDFREADLSSVDADFWGRIIDRRSAFPQRDNCYTAMIVSDDLQYGLIRMLQLLSEGKLPQRLMAFRDYKEGEQWLLEK